MLDKILTTHSPPAPRACLPINISLSLVIPIKIDVYLSLHCLVHCLFFCCFSLNSTSQDETDHQAWESASTLYEKARNHLLLRNIKVSIFHRGLVFVFWRFERHLEKSKYARKNGNRSVGVILGFMFYKVILSRINFILFWNFSAVSPFRIWYDRMALFEPALWNLPIRSTLDHWSNFIFSIKAEPVLALQRLKENRRRVLVNIGRYSCCEVHFNRNRTF